MGHAAGAARFGRVLVVVYALLPLGLGGTLGTATVAEDATAIAFYKTAFDVSSATPSARC